MRRSNNIEIKRTAKLWAIYDVTRDGLELVRKEVIPRGKPKCEGRQVTIAIAKGHVVYTMAYDDFIKNAKAEFIKEETNNAD